MNRWHILLLVSVLCLPATVSAQTGACRTVCMPDEVLDQGTGCCITSTETAVVRDETVASCTPGQVMIPGASACCWPGQVFAGGACRGIPSDCPIGFSVVAEECVLSDCDAGRDRAADGVTCCWPGQAVADGVCRGVPDSCPPTHRIMGEDCSDADYRAEQEHDMEARAQQNMEDEEARLRDETIAAARSVGGFDSGLGFLAVIGFQSAIPDVWANVPYYVGPRLGLLQLAGPIEFLPEIGVTFEPDGSLLVFDLRAELGIHILSFPNTTTSAVSIINLTLGIYVELWAGEGSPDDLVFGGAYIANTSYFDCGVGVRIQYNQTILGTYGPILPSATLALVLGARDVDDPGEHDCSGF